ILLFVITTYPEKKFQTPLQYSIRKGKTVLIHSRNSAAAASASNSFRHSHANTATKKKSSNTSTSLPSASPPTSFPSPTKTGSSHSMDCENSTKIQALD